VTVPAEHLVIRELKTWRSYGIEGKGPIQDTLIKDIGDEHLLKIIKHLEDRYGLSGDNIPLPTVYDIMHAELAWRMHGIWASYPF
jgi:hypothetical protein